MKSGLLEKNIDKIDWTILSINKNENIWKEDNSYVLK